MGAFIAQLDATVVNVSLASLAVELHASLSDIQWVTSGYLLALALLLPLNGWLVDRIGAKALYLCCFASFTLSSALCGCAWSAASLIGFRILQGMSGGLLAPMAQMMLARAAGRHLAKVVGFAAVPVLLAPLLGPVVAGAILSVASWRWLFLVNLPVGVLALVLAAVFLPGDRGETTARPLDVVGLLLLSPGLVAFLYGIDHLGVWPGDAALAAAVAMLALFGVSAGRKGAAALIDLRLLGGRTFSAALTTMFLMNGVSFAGQMLIPIFLVRGCGLSPGDTGWLMAPLGLGMICTYPLMGALTEWFGIRRLAASGSLIALIGILPFLYLARHGLERAVLIPALFVRGMGMERDRNPVDHRGLWFGGAQGPADGDRCDEYRPATRRPDPDDAGRERPRLEARRAVPARRPDASVRRRVRDPVRPAWLDRAGGSPASPARRRPGGAAMNRAVRPISIKFYRMQTTSY